MKPSQNIINRKNYIEKIIPFIKTNLIKVIVGQRRVGKSYLLLQLIDYIKDKYKKPNIIYINKENYDFDNIKNYKNLIDYVNDKKNDKNNFLFIDEIQDIDEFEKALRHFTLEQDIDIYCTGSNAKLLSGELASTLSGRYIEFKVFSLSYLEFIKFHNFQNNEETLKKYLYWGGLPFLKNLEKSENVISEYLKNIFSTIIYKDVVARYNIRNTFFLENLVKYLAGNVGSIISAKKISDYLKSQNLKMSPQIVLTYLDYLKYSFLIFNVRRSDILGKKNFEINEKFYFEDWGIKNALLGFNNVDIGQVIENVIYIHLKSNDYNVMVGKYGEKEIDFICEKNGEKVYIQACYLMSDEKVVNREYSNLMEIRDNYIKLVVSLDRYAKANYKGIKHLYLMDFLSNFK